MFLVIRHTFLVLVCLLFSTLVFGADPQPYKVEFASLGDDDMDSTLKATSDLQSLRTSAAVSPFGLIARARSDQDRLKTVLESFGYYESRVEVKVNGLPLSDPGLGEALTAIPRGDDARVQVNFVLGARYQLRRVDIDGNIPAGIDARQVLGLTTGEPAVAASVLGGGARLLSALEELGYAFARVDPPVAYEALDVPALDVSFHVTAGPKVNIGEIRVEGLKRVHERLVRNRLLIHSGDPYKPSVLEHARRDLLALNVFGQVSVEVGTAVDASGGVPVTFKMRERARHAVSVTAAFSTDLGGSGGASWTDRNVFGNAEQLTFAASVINLGGSETNGVGYDASAKYLIPEFLHRDQSLQVAVEATKQYLQAYDQTARTASATLSRKLSSVWAVSAGAKLTYETVIQPPPDACVVISPGSTCTYDYTLVALPLALNYDSTHLASPLDDPVGGYRASLSLTPTVATGHQTSFFLISQIRASTYFDLEHLLGTTAGRSVIAVRALAGLAQGAGQFGLPPDQRFYGGGSSTIRGYEYQTVGPSQSVNCPRDTPCNAQPCTSNATCTIYPIGGTAITAGTIEWRQRFGGSFGAAFFVDAGQVSAKLKFLPDDLQVGVGTGLRYYTPIGPIRVDFAVPTHHQAGTDHFEIYIGIGQAF
jgi:translocation and assembly module TamA